MQAMLILTSAARHSSREHDSTVAPVVSMSSTTIRCLPHAASPFLSEKAFSTLPCLSHQFFCVWLSRNSLRLTMSVRTGSPVASAMPFAMYSLWL